MARTTTRFARLALLVVGLMLIGMLAACSGDNVEQELDAAASGAPTLVQPAPENLQRLAQPVVAPPVGNRAPTVVKYELETLEVVAQLDDGVAYHFWTFNGTIPGPMMRVRQGDTVELTLKNSPDSLAMHSIDLHSVTGPGGGAAVTQIKPGGEAVFSFKALNPGVYVYHCATAPVPMHVTNGMYGMIVVEPEGGLPAVDREFYVMQGDFYLTGARGEQGLHDFDMNKMLNETPDYVVFNGSVGALTGDNALKAQVGETVRIFFGVGGVNVPSSFHVIGEIFDSVAVEGGSLVNHNVQTTNVPTGGATYVDFKVEVPGNYTLVDHSLGRVVKGAAGILVVEGQQNPDVFNVIKPGEGVGGH